MKKSYIDSIENPAELFITKPAGEDHEQAAAEKPPRGYKVNPGYIETRSKRVQLLMQPSLYKKLSKAAKKQKRSVNDLIHTILEEYTGKEQ